MNFNRIKFIDLFAGVGGIRLGFERACEQNSFIPECVFTSEIDDKACEIYRKNFKDKHNPKFDITVPTIVLFNNLLLSFKYLP